MEELRVRQIPMPVYEPHTIESPKDDYVLFKYFRKNLKKETLADLIRESRYTDTDTDKKFNPDTIAMVGMARLLISKKFFRSQLKPIFTLFKETYPDYLTVFRIKEPEQTGEPEKEEEEEEQEQEEEEEPELIELTKLTEKQPPFSLLSFSNAVGTDYIT